MNCYKDDVNFIIDKIKINEKLIKEYTEENRELRSQLLRIARNTYRDGISADQTRRLPGYVKDEA